MTYIEFTTKSEALEFCNLVNLGENIEPSEDKITSGYTQPIPFRDKWYVRYDEITSNYTELEPIDLDSTPIDTTPPPSNGYGIEIPEQFQWAFPIRLNGFIVELKDKDGIKYCEVSGLSWTAFINEFDKPYNNDYRLSVLPIWQYAMGQAANNNFIAL